MTGKTKHATCEIKLANTDTGEQLIVCIRSSLLLEDSGACVTLGKLSNILREGKHVQLVAVKLKSGIWADKSPGGYWTHSVFGRHHDELPTYASGERIFIRPHELDGF